MFAPQKIDPSKTPDARARESLDKAPGEKAPRINPHWQSLALGSNAIRAKLDVSQPGDAYEQEADRVADRVMRMTTPLSSAVGSGDPTRSLSSSAASPSVAPDDPQQHFVPGGGEVEKTLQREQQGGNADDLATAPSIVSEVLTSAAEPLADSTRSVMEDRFGHNFSHVRVHTNTQAADSAQALNAQAYTVGRDVVFNRGQYNPGSPGGQRLIAHELAHVRQQDSGTVQRKIQRSRLLDFSDIRRPDFEPLALTDAQIEATNEFRSYMDPTLVWQVNEHMTRREALQACRLIVADLRAGIAVDWQTRARVYMNRAREAALPDTGLATEIGFELDPGSRPAPVAPPPPPPVGGPPPPPPVAPARMRWDGAVDPAAAAGGVGALLLETARAVAARVAMAAELFNAFDAYMNHFRPNAIAALANRVPFNTPAPAGGAGPPATGVIDIANQARDVLETRYGSTMNAAAPSAEVTAGRAQRTSAAGSQNIFDSASEADRLTLTGRADLAPDVAWWLFGNDVPGVRPPGAEFASVVVANHHYSATDDPDGATNFRWAVANAYAAAATLAPSNRQQLIDYRLTQWSEADPSGLRGFTALSSFDPGANAGRAELERRWGIFRTSTHESLHLRTHPGFKAAEQRRDTMTEGFTEMFTVSTLNTDVLPRARAGSVEPLRRTVEGALSPAAPDPTIITNRVTPTQYLEHLAHAERIRDGGTAPGGTSHVGVGEAAVRAAFFQGHVEYIGLDPAGTQLAGLRAPGVAQQTRIPGGLATLAALVHASGVPLATIQADNPGITDALPATAVLRGCSEHWVVAGETRTLIAAQRGVTEADLIRANPDIPNVANAWPVLPAGQKLLIPAH